MHKKSALKRYISGHLIQCLQLTNEETEAQKLEGTFSMPHSKLMKLLIPG